VACAFAYDPDVDMSAHASQDCGLRIDLGVCWCAPMAKRAGSVRTLRFLLTSLESGVRAMFAIAEIVRTSQETARCVAESTRPVVDRATATVQ